MPNRHAPQSHPAYPPKSHVTCHHCAAPILAQHVRPEHVCTEHCHEHGADHDYRMEQLPPLARYFDDQFNEMCKGCAEKPAAKRPRHGVRHA